jgi:N-acetylglucosamine transport system substrate-binding protein
MQMSKKSVTRRQFLKGLGAVASLGATASVLAACGGAAAPASESGQKTTAPTSTQYFMGFEAANKEQWSRIPADHKKGTLVGEKDWYKILGDVPKEPIVIAGFKGGWGELWIDAVIESMKADFPGIQIEKDFDPRIWEKMKPRLVAGEVPDWMYYVIGPWGGEWKKGIEEKVMVPCDFLLDVEAFGIPGKRVGEVIQPGALAAANASLTDAQWTMPLSLSVYGLYYNVDMFEKNGWKAPDQLSYEDFLEQNKAIKAAGVAPFTYAGKYPGYWEFGFLQSLWYKKAGEKAFCDMDNLVPGAFLNPDLAWGIEQVQSFFKNDWIYPGSDALSHTESQQVFVDGKAAMIPNGSWMPNEQRETTPPDFRMAFSGVPMPSDGKGYKDAIAYDRGAAELQVGNGKNPLWGMEVMRRIYSPTAQRIWAEQIGSPNAMINVVKDVKPTPAWESAAKAIERAQGHNIVLNYGAWYPELGKQWGDAIGDIVTGKIAPMDALQLLEQGAQLIRDNPDIKKFTRECKA